MPIPKEIIIKKGQELFRSKEKKNTKSLIFIFSKICSLRFLGSGSPDCRRSRRLVGPGRTTGVDIKSSILLWNQLINQSVNQNHVFKCWDSWIISTIVIYKKNKYLRSFESSILYQSFMYEFDLQKNKIKFLIISKW